MLPKRSTVIATGGVSLTAENNGPQTTSTGQIGQTTTQSKTTTPKLATSGQRGKEDSKKQQADPRNNQGSQKQVLGKSNFDLTLNASQQQEKAKGKQFVDSNIDNYLDELDDSPRVILRQDTVKAV